jgi:hypothetical protein
VARKRFLNCGSCDRSAAVRILAYLMVWPEADVRRMVVLALLNGTAARRQRRWMIRWLGYVLTTGTAYYVHLLPSSFQPGLGLWCDRHAPPSLEALAAELGGSRRALPLLVWQVRCCSIRADRVRFVSFSEMAMCCLSPTVWVCRWHVVTLASPCLVGVCTNVVQRGPAAGDSDPTGLATFANDDSVCRQPYGPVCPPPVFVLPSYLLLWRVVTATGRLIGCWCDSANCIAASTAQPLAGDDPIKADRAVQRTTAAGWSDGDLVIFQIPTAGTHTITTCSARLRRRLEHDRLRHLQDVGSFSLRG